MMYLLLLQRTNNDVEEAHRNTVCILLWRFSRIIEGSQFGFLFNVLYLTFKTNRRNVDLCNPIRLLRLQELGELTIAEFIPCRTVTFCNPILYYMCWVNRQILSLFSLEPLIFVILHPYYIT